MHLPRTCQVGMHHVSTLTTVKKVVEDLIKMMDGVRVSNVEHLKC